MPELPEVEATRRRLEPELKADQIAGGRVLWHRTVSPKPESFLRSLKGAFFSGVQRRGKYLIVQFEKLKKILVIHLRMSGRLELTDGDLPLRPHDRLQLRLRSGRDLRFHDVRKFGRAVLVSSFEDLVPHLGPEPLDPNLTPSEFFRMLQAKGRMLKPLLLDQSFVAGLGNIYVDEILWSGRLHPERRANELSRNESGALFRAMRSIIQKAVEQRGTDFGDQVITDGVFVPRAYGRGGSGCKRCNTTMVRMIVAQRGTTICPECQKPAH